MAITPEEAKRKYEENFAKKAPIIVAHATRADASDRYKKNLGDFLGLSPADLADEDAKRVKEMGKLTAEELAKKVKGKGEKWYANLKEAMAA